MDPNNILENEFTDPVAFLRLAKNVKFDITITTQILMGDGSSTSRITREHSRRTMM